MLVKAVGKGQYSFWFKHVRYILAQGEVKSFPDYDLADISERIKHINGLAVISEDNAMGALYADHSVNDSCAKFAGGELILLANKKHTGQIAGNFNGGGSGNKPIFGFYGYHDTPLADFPVITGETEIRVDDGDADEQELGLSWNFLIDLLGDGGSLLAIATATKTLGGETDKYSETGASASMPDFDISTDHFFIVGGLPSYTGGTVWFSNEVTLADVITASQPDYSTNYPNAKIIDTVSPDGGHPAGVKMAAITAQIGGSGNALKSVLAVTELVIGGKTIL